MTIFLSPAQLFHASQRWLGRDGNKDEAMIIACGVGGLGGGGLGICTVYKILIFVGLGRDVIVLPIFLETTLRAQICHLLFWMEGTCHCTKVKSLKLKV